jgi:hypothetical protein
VPNLDVGFYLFVPSNGASPMVARVTQTSKCIHRIANLYRLDGKNGNGVKRIPVLVSVALKHGKFLPLAANSGDFWVPLNALKSRLAHNGNGH